MNSILEKLLALLFKPLNALREMLSHNGALSSKRGIMALSAITLCLCLFLLTVTICYIILKNPILYKIDTNLVFIFSALSVPAATLAGAAYIGKKEIPEDTTTSTPRPTKPVAPIAPSLDKKETLLG